MPKPSGGKGRRMLTRKACKYRLYPTHSQEQALHWTLARCRELYNVALQERRDAYRMRGVSIRCYDQINQLPSIKAARPEYADIHSQVLQDVLRRVDKAMQAFFRRVNQGRSEAGLSPFPGTQPLRLLYLSPARAKPAWG